MANDMLDAPLLALSKSDHFTFRDAAQNCLVTGVTGGGKTSGPGRHILEALLRAGCGGIVLAAKPGEADEIRALAAKTGRLDSLLILNTLNWALNLLDATLARLGPDGAGGTVEYLMRVVEIVRNASALRGGDGEAFWLDELKRMLRHTLPPLHGATGTLRLADIMAFIRSAPTSLDQMRDADWQRQSFFFEVMAAVAPHVPDATGEQWMGYWREVSQMDAKLRGSILAGFTMLDRLNHGWLREVFTTHTSLPLSMVFHGAVIVVDLPRATHGDDGVVASMLLKDAVQTEILGRNALAPVHRERFCFIYADECQEVVTSRDAEFLGMSRSSRCATIYLTQSLPILYAKVGGQHAHDRVHSLTANMGVRIFCANSCTTTNQWAAETIGKSVQRRASFNASEGTNISYGSSMGESSQWNREARDSNFMGDVGGFGWSVEPKWGRNGSEGGGDSYGRNRGHGSNQGTSRGYSEAVDWVVEPAFFARSLKTGGPANGNRVGAIWTQAGRRFAASGGPSLLVEFAQCGSLLSRFACSGTRSSPCRSSACVASPSTASVKSRTHGRWASARLSSGCSS